MNRKELKDRYAIVGAAATPTARSHAPDKSNLMLEAWAAKLAIEDAGLRRSDINGAVHTMMASPHPPMEGTDTYSRMLGLRPNFYMTVARGGQTAHNGILLATQMLSLGLADYVLVSCAITGWSSSHVHRRTDGEIGLKVWPKPDYGLAATGWAAAAGAGSIHGMLASRHMHEYGTTHEQLGAVAIAARQWAALNPAARLTDRPLSMEQYLASPFVTEPLRTADCCVTSDLGAALVITTADRARDLAQTAVYIKGIGVGDQARSQWWDKTNYTRFDGGHAKQSAFREAEVSNDDIDVLELYDCFTTETLIHLEDYGFCAKGEGGAFVESGAIAPGGSLPVNTHGGQLAYGYLFDFPGVLEAVHQLRGSCGGRQVHNARLALTNGHGGEMLLPQMCSSHATMVLGSEVG